MIVLGLCFVWGLPQESGSQATVEAGAGAQLYTNLSDFRWCNSCISLEQPYSVCSPSHWMEYPSMTHDKSY